MYSLKKTAKAFFAAAKIKQSTDNVEVRSSVNNFFASLGKNAIVVTDDVDPKDIVITENVDPDDIVITDDDNPLDDIIIIDDDNPLNAAVKELKSIEELARKEATKTACEDLIQKLRGIISAVSALQ